MAHNNSTAATACASCGKTSTDLKRCAKCHSEHYCNRDCQKAHWKTHKKVCASRAAAATALSSSNNTASNGSGTSSSTTTGTSSPKNLDVAIPNPFTRLDARTWLHDRSERDTYKLLIDAYRLRMEDDYNFEGDVDDDCVLSGLVSSSIGGFTRFLRLLHRRAPDLLPSWWNKGKEEECKRAGMRRWAWEDLGCTVEKSDIVEHYGDARMPMQLRMFAETIYGQGPGGQSGTVMREMMMAMENGGADSGLQIETVDTSALLAGLMSRH
ncbi:putative MYND domain protein [Macrophomina phaseolina]|uniref:MYND domain protein n=1 Tax=Macrophomina phaseolina TaxID=35725 RepID=A0ABQ8G4J2_9PEZI|nr:putative MYND domain protein [Macrophomina phaseolina]